MTLIDFTLSNARRFYSSMGNPLAVKGLDKEYVSTYLFAGFKEWVFGCFSYPARRNRIDSLIVHSYV